MHKTVTNLIQIQKEIHSKNTDFKVDPKIIAVSKTFLMQDILPLIDHGHRDFGENKVQEAVDKWTEIKVNKSNLNLHMIGKLQTNKVKFAVKIFDYIHSLDSIKLATKISEEQKKIKKNITSGIAYVYSTFNNTIISIADENGNVVSWSSAGKMGFRGSKKNTPYAAQLAAEDAVKVAHEAGMRKVKVYVKGPGNGRESAIRSIHNAGVEVTEIFDVTPIPHNGCRPPKRRRV